VASDLRFHLLDVFTDRRFCGNPLAVVEAADHLADDEMQAIAREFNFSETVFLIEPHDPVHTARARIFTPRWELPFAGHPTIGAAALIAESRANDILARSGVVVVLEEKIGAIKCEARRAPGGATYAQFDAPTPPARIGAAPSRESLADALSVRPDDIGFASHTPARYSAGAEFVFVPLQSRAALDRARRTERFPDAIGEAVGAYLYTNDGADAEIAISARMLANGLGFDEDPATGSAAAAFAGVAHEFENPDDGEHELHIEQGRAMGRPSRMTLRMTVDAGRLAGVAVGGRVLRVAEGTLRL
jgi:trans-2,3-dihydro-3-hydroxyanthranilate isomerase